MKTFTLYSDPGHGWLKVTPADCESLGMVAESFTAYSYRDEKFFYLEEDCDASRFVLAYESRHGKTPAIKHSNRNSDSPIRRLARIHQNY
jgi:hypothetical protein